MLLLLISFFCGVFTVLIILGLYLYLFSVYNVAKTTLLKYVKRFFNHQPMQRVFFKIKLKAFNLGAYKVALRIWKDYFATGAEERTKYKAILSMPCRLEWVGSLDAFLVGIYPVLQRENSIAINNLFLPEDVLLEILARLPVKSLLRFRTVSKSWRDIIKEPTFITKHHLTQASSKDGKCVLFKIVCNDPRRSFGFLAIEQGGVKFTRWELPGLSSANYYQAAGPCNGIFIISDEYHQLFLWNPATREYKALPPSLEMSLSDRFSCVGFGIDPISKDYKVVRVWAVWNFGRSDDDEFIGKVEVMSLSATDLCRPKSETWKIIDAVPSIHLVRHSTDQVYANGKYYWLDEMGRIVWFDMGAEVFGLIHVPQLFFGSCYNKITVVKGSLAVIRHASRVEEDKNMFEIWTTDDYPWTKYATIGPLMGYQAPLGLWSNQEAIVFRFTEEPDPADELKNQCTHQVFSYDIKTNVIKKEMESLDLDMYYPIADIYSETLISFMG